MKPKFRSIAAAFAPFSRASLIICASLCAATSANADQTWTGASDALWSNAANWNGFSVPDTSEKAIFNGGANLTIDTGANQSAGGILVNAPTGPVTLNNNTLTVGSLGIDMSAATQNLTIGSAVTTASAVSQTWKVASGRQLTVNGAFAGANNSAVRLDTSAGGIINIASGTASTMLGRFATFGQTDLAGLDASKNVVAGNTVITYNPNPNTGAALPTIGNATYTVIDVVNSNTSNPSAFRLGGTSINVSTGVRFNTPHATGLTWSVDLASSRNLAMHADTAILVGPSINTDVTFGGSGTLRTYGSGEHKLHFANFSSSNLIFNCGLSVSSGRTWRFTKSGSGKVVFAGTADSVNGGISINEGTVQIGNGGATGAINGGGAYSVASGATLAFNRSDTALSVGSVISGDGAVSQVGSGTVSLTGTNTYAGGTSITSGSIGASAVANFGTGDITLNGGGVTFNGAFDLTGSNVIIGPAGATLNTNGNDITLGNSFASGSSGSLTKTGAGTLILSVDNDYTGGTVVNGGTLLAEASTSSTGSGTVTVNSGAKLGGAGTIAGTANIMSGGILAPGSSVGALTVGGLDLDAGSTGVFEFNNSPDNDRVTVSTSGGLTIDGGAITLLQEGTSTPFSAPGTYNLIAYSGAIGGAGVSSLSVANPQAGFNYVFAANGGNVTLTISATGVISHWVTDGSGSWTDGANWSDGVPNGTSATAIFDTALTSPATVSLNGSKTVGAITLDSDLNGYTIDEGTLGSTITLNNGAVGDSAIVNNGGNHVISAAVNLVTNTAISNGIATDSTTLSGVVSGSATLTKTGAASLALLGNNTLSGNLTLNGGSTTFATNGLGTGNLAISGASLIWGDGVTANTQDISDRTVTFGSDPVTFDTNGNDVVLANSIGNSGSAAFTKAGLGTLELSSNATFTGTVTIANGVLQLGSGGTSGMVSANIINNGQLTISRSDNLNFANVISGTGSLSKLGSNDLQLASANTFSGTTSIAGGSITMLDPLALQNSTLDYQSAGGSLSFGTLTAATLGGLSGDRNLALENTTPAAVTLTVGGNNANTTYSGVLSGTGASLTKTGTGELTLTAAQTYDGATTVNGGLLTLDLGASISGTSLATSGTGRMKIVDGALTQPVINLGVGSGGLYMLGGTSTVSGAVNAAGSTGSTNSGPVLVYGGTLSASSIILGRGGLNQSTDPAQAPIDTNLYLAGGDVNVSGNLYVGTFSDQPNSSVVTRIDAGTLTVDGAIVVGLNNGGRWSMVDVNGGTLLSTSSGVDMGVVLGGPWAGKAALLVRSGTATVERIQLGQAAVAGSGLVSLTGGELYVGADGILQGSTAPTFTSEIRLGGGTLGAKANWTSSLPVTTTATTSSVIKAADGSGNPFDITLSGTITGTGNIEKAGDGTLTLSGNYGFAGDTKVFAGQLKVQSKTFNDTTGVYVDAASGATLNLDYSGGDRVAYFYINDNLQADGVYGAVGSGAQFETSAITGSGLLYVNTEVPVSGYATWATANAGGQDPDGDFDNDGVSNGVEYFLGQAGSNFTANPGLVGGTVTWTNGGNIASSAYGTEFVVQTSTNLVSWTDVLVTDPNLNNLAGSVSYTPTGAGKQFVRLKVTPN